MKTKLNTFDIYKIKDIKESSCQWILFVMIYDFLSKFLSVCFFNPYSEKWLEKIKLIDNMIVTWATVEIHKLEQIDTSLSAHRDTQEKENKTDTN